MHINISQTAETITLQNILKTAKHCKKSYWNISSQFTCIYFFFKKNLQGIVIYPVEGVIIMQYQILVFLQSADHSIWATDRDSMSIAAHLWIWTVKYCGYYRYKKGTIYVTTFY